MKIKDELYDRITEFYEGKKTPYNSVLVEMHEEKGSLSEFIQKDINEIFNSNLFDPWHPVKENFSNSFGLFQIVSTAPNHFQVMVKPNEAIQSVQLNINITPSNTI